MMPTNSGLTGAPEMPDGHILLADWFFLLAWILAVLYAVCLFLNATHKAVPVLFPLSLACLGFGFWVL
jgi:hypothetical protein